MPTKNGYAALVKNRGDGGKRRKLDDYETPEGKTKYLTDAVEFTGPILEPACGSGRMVRALREQTGAKVTGTDIKTGHDFLKRTKPFAGDIITNPPYRDGLADAFVRHALKLADRHVAMLMETKYLHGSDRAAWLYSLARPSHVIIIPERIYFFEGSGKPIPSQFFNHVWIVWPWRKARERGGYDTVMSWAGD